MKRRSNYSFLKLLMILLLLLTVVTAVSCGSKGSEVDEGKETEKKEAEVTDNSKAKLNPPEWLIGYWIPKDGRENEDIEVTKDNVTVSSGNLDMNWQVDNNILEITETTDGDTYTLSYVSMDTNVSYTFEPNGDGEMKRTVSMDDVETSNIFVRK